MLNGPNLNLLGVREPETYGTATLAEVEKLCRQVTDELGWDLDFRQTNHEGELVEAIQQAGVDQRDGEPGRGGAQRRRVHPHQHRAGRRDRRQCVRVIEVHISNVHRRESFRHHSYVSAHAAGIIVGLGVAGYPLAIRALAGLIQAV